MCVDGSLRIPVSVSLLRSSSLPNNERPWAGCIWVSGGEAGDVDPHYLLIYTVPPLAKPGLSIPACQLVGEQ